MNKLHQIPSDDEIWEHIKKLGLEHYFHESRPKITNPIKNIDIQ